MRVAGWAVVLIGRDQTIAGLSAVAARDLMRRVRECAVTLGYLADLLDIPDTQARSIIDALHTEGLLCRVDRHDRSFTLVGRADPDGMDAGLEWWGTTIAGNALGKARIGKPMTRPQAQRLLDQLIERVIAVNADAASVLSVVAVDVFGSFADPERDQVGDVDVLVMFDRRVDGDEFIERSLAAADHAERQGRRFATFHDRLSHLEMSFRRDIRGRSPRLDVQFEPAGGQSRLPPGTTLHRVYTR